MRKKPPSFPGTIQVSEASYPSSPRPLWEERTTCAYISITSSIKLGGTTTSPRRLKPSSICRCLSCTDIPRAVVKLACL